MASRRRLRKPVLIALLMFPLALILSLFLFLNNWHFFGVKSIHEDASKYKTRHCLAFYPETEDGRSYAKTLCKGVKDDTVYDYSLVPYGDYYLVSYGNDLKYFVDKEMHKMEIKELTEELNRQVEDSRELGQDIFFRTKNGKLFTENTVKIYNDDLYFPLERILRDWM